MKYGLSEAQLQEIIAFIGQYAEVEAAVLFGSRAIDTYKEASDVDIALKGARVTHGLAAKMKFDIEEDTYLPFFFDFVAYPLITNEALKTHIDTKGVVIFRRVGSGEWKVCKLGDIVVFNYGKSLISQNRVYGNIPVYSSAGLTGYHNESLTSSEGLIVGRKGTIGKVYYSQTPFFCIDTAFYILPHENKFHLRFMYYLLQTLGLDSLNEDSAVPGLNRETAYSQAILFPPLPEQRAIAGVLSSLDDKIDLLYRQNKTLEAMAEALFRQWFIEEADAGWEVQPLGNLITVKRGGSPRPIQDYLSNAGLRWLKISDATREGSPYIFEIKEFIKESGLNKTTLLKSGALVLSNSATPGIPKILQVDTCIHDGWLHFPESYFSKEFLYLLFKTLVSAKRHITLKH